MNYQYLCKQFAISTGSSSFYNIFNLLIMLTFDTMRVDGGLSSWGALESCNVTWGGGLQGRVLKFLSCFLMAYSWNIVSQWWLEWVESLEYLH